MQAIWPGTALEDVKPQHIVDYITYRMQLPGRGRTTVHKLNCAQLRTEHPTCGCPTYGKHNSTQLVVKHLKTELGKLVSANRWEEASSTGNAAASRLVTEFLQAIDDEQRLAGVVTRQPVLLHYNKLRHVAYASFHIIRAHNEYPPLARWQAARFHCAMLVSHQTWARCGNIVKFLALSVLRIPDSAMLVFGHTWGKTLFDGKEHLCGVLPHEHREMCIPTAMRLYTNTTCELQQPFSPGFLFKSAPGGHEQHVEAAALERTLQSRLSALGIGNGETFAGIRASGATQAMVTGTDLHKIMQTANWSCPETAAYYTRLQEMLGLKTVPLITSQPADDISHVDELASLMSAYPPQP